MELGRVNAYDGECLCFEVLALQKLKHLFLLDMRGLKTMKIHKGALPLLEHLEIGPSPQMREVPSGIRLLKSLKSIHFWGMLREFTRSMLPEDGKKYHIVEHLPNVFFHFFHSGCYNTKNVIPNPG